MNLSDSQRRFCQLVVDGRSHTEAYRQSYPNCKSPNAAGVSATRMLRNDKVREEIKRLRKMMDSKLGLTRLRKRQILRNIAEDESLPAHQRIQAIATDNKMMGHDEPNKVQVDIGSHQLVRLLQMIREGGDEALKKSR